LSVWVKSADNDVKLIQYLLLAIVICIFVFLILSIFSDEEFAFSISILCFPLALWSARLMVAFRKGTITRRIPLLDGGPVRSGQFWSFFPDVYKRKPGFDGFKGYFFKETVCCTFFWLMFLLPALMQILRDAGFDV